MASEHAAPGPNDAAAAEAAVRATQATAGALPAAAIPVVALTGALARFGINLNQFPAHAVGSGAALNEFDFKAFVLDLGHQISLNINEADLLGHMLCLTLDTLGSDKVKGSVMLTEAASGNTYTMDWSSFYSKLSTFAAGISKEATPRSTMRALHAIFEEIYFKDLHPDVVMRRQEGTPQSKRVVMPNNKNPEPYVLVPELFRARMTNEEHEAFRMYSDGARVREAVNVTRVDRLDADGSIAQHRSERAEHDLTFATLQSAGQLSKRQGETAMRAAMLHAFTGSGRSLADRFTAGSGAP